MTTSPSCARTCSSISANWVSKGVSRPSSSARPAALLGLSRAYSAYRGRATARTASPTGSAAIPGLLGGLPPPLLLLLLLLLLLAPAPGGGPSPAEALQDLLALGPGDGLQQGFAVLEGRRQQDPARLRRRLPGQALPSGVRGLRRGLGRGLPG